MSKVLCETKKNPANLTLDIKSAGFLAGVTGFEPAATEKNIVVSLAWGAS